MAQSSSFVEFLKAFKSTTEAYWNRCQPDPFIYGFQFQIGTTWRPGLLPAQIAEYQDRVRAKFPIDFKAMLSMINGTDRPTINLFGSSGLPQRTSPGVYSYPDDYPVILARMKGIRSKRDRIYSALTDQGLSFPHGSKLVPIFLHRFVVCTEDAASSVVLSIHGTDAIMYGRSLQEYLEHEFRKELAGAA